jgi:hypothetical protein
MEELPNLAKKIKDQVPEGKALFVFEAEGNFIFDSDNENIVQPIKNGLIYKLMIDIEPKSGAITIKNDFASDAFINYGKSHIVESFPALKSKEVKYFKLSLVTSLSCYDVTNQMKKAGATDFQGLYDKEALIVINVVPKDLRLKIVGKEIRDTIHEEGRYKVYVKPTNQKIALRLKNYEDAIIEFENDELKSKDVKYFRVETPQTIVDIDESGNNDIKVGNYSITSKPSGALIQMTGNPDFNKSKYMTPYTLEGYSSGSKAITLTLNNYETIKDTISISSTKGKKSNYNFIPKFAFINCNIDPPIPISKIIMDESELSIIEEGKDYECSKGSHTITISAPHYYSETKQIDLAAGRTSEINIKLKPIMGSLSVLSGINATGAEVKLNDRKIGVLPIKDLPLQEGSYKLSFVKSGYVSGEITYPIKIEENKLTNFTDLKMIDAKKVYIKTYPVSGATVYIDDILIKERSNLTITLGVGKHAIKIEHDNYKTYVGEFIVNQENEEYSFQLEKESYEVIFNTKPSSITIYVDGEYKGLTRQNLSYGKHKIKFESSHFLTKKKNIFVSKDKTINTKLFPKESVLLGMDWGLSQYRINAAYNNKRIFYGFSIGFNKKPNEVSPIEVKSNNVTIDDINMYNNEYGRIYDSTGSTSYSIKTGYTFKKPIIFIVTIGCSYIMTDWHQKVYKAKHDYFAQNSSLVIHKDELFSLPVVRNSYLVYTCGLIVPIKRFLYFSMDYYSNSDIGSGIALGLGFNIFINYL